MALSVNYIHGSGQTALREAIQQAAAGSQEINIAAAFLTMGGAREVVGLLGAMAPGRHRRVRIVAGLTGVTEPDALSFLLKVPQVELRLSGDRAFHVKLYAFYHDRKALCLTGSANLTAKGMTGEGELLVKLEDGPSSSLARQTKDVFRRMWEQSAEADLAAIAAYASGWKRRTWKPHFPPGLKNWMSQAMKPRPRSRDPKHLWFPVTGLLPDRAVAAIRQSSGWVGDRPTEDSGVLASRSQGYFGQLETDDFIWTVSLYGGVKVDDRAIEKHRLVGKCNEEIKGAGAYWYSTAVELSVPLPRILEEFRSIGIVRKWHPIDRAQHLLTPGKLRKLERLVAAAMPNRKAARTR